MVPSILAENAGLSPISTVTELRNRHARGETSAGINVRKVSYILGLSVPLPNITALKYMCEQNVLLSIVLLTSILLLISVEILNSKNWLYYES